MGRGGGTEEEEKEPLAASVGPRTHPTRFVPRPRPSRPWSQLCINYANETLQFFFALHVFKLEQDEYDRERINWSKIDFSDNQACLDLISKRPVGVLMLLDDESNFPRGTDEGFCQKATDQHKSHENFLCPKTRSAMFGVKHYAGPVWYVSQ